jgi:PAS domain S-box-containing protein
MSSFEVCRTARMPADETSGSHERRFLYPAEEIPLVVILLDAAGAIVATNSEWDPFSLACPTAGQHPLDLGSDYLHHCDSGNDGCAVDTRAFAVGIRAVLNGPQEYFEMEYSGYVEGQTRWYLGRVARASGHDTACAIVTHEDITERKQRAAHLQDLERTLRAFYNSAPMMTGVVELHNDEIIPVSRNWAAARFFGIPSNEPNGSPANAPSRSTETHAIWIKNCRKSEQNAMPTRFTYRYNRNGVLCWLSATVCFVALMPTGRPRFSYVIEDITDRVNAEESLRRSEERQRQMFEEATVGMMVVDLDGNLIRVNPALCNLLGYSREQLAGKTYRDLLMADDVAFSERFRARFISGNRDEVNLEARCRHQSGATVHVWLKIVMHRNAQGNPETLTAQIIDITQRKRDEEAVRRSEAQLAEAQRIGRLGSWEFDIATRKTSWSREMFHLLGRDYRLGEPPMDEALSDYRPEDAAKILETMTRAIREGTSYGLDVRRICRDGSTRWFYLRGDPVRDETGKVIRLVGVLLDITERKQAEQEMDALHKRLRQARALETDISARVQSSLLTPTVPDDLSGVEIAVLSQPSQKVDGDFSDFIVHSDLMFDLIIGDVMGKGLSAALLGAATKAQILRCFIHLLSNASDVGLTAPGALMRRVHETLTPRLIELETFITAAYVRFDLAHQQIFLVDCGHTSTIHCQAQTGECGFIVGTSLPLGVMENATYREVRIPFGPGDLFVFYSDGITEAFDPQRKMFGGNRLLELTRSHRHLAPQQLVDTIHHAVQEHTHSSHFADDVTCIVVRIDDVPHGPGAGHAACDRTDD